MEHTEETPAPVAAPLPKLKGPLFYHGPTGMWSRVSAVADQHGKYLIIPVSKTFPE